MGSRIYKPGAQTLTPGLIELTGTIETTTSGTISTTNSKTYGFTVTRQGVGAYDIVVDDNYAYWEGITPSLFTTAGTIPAQQPTAWVLSFSRATAWSKTRRLAWNIAGAAAELPNGAGFHLVLRLSNTILTR